MLGGAGSVVLVFCMMPKAEVGTKSRVTHWKSYREKRALCVVDINY